MASTSGVQAERQRLAEDQRREKNWKRWGPYLAERQWGTVREDYSPDGDCWHYFPHDHARSRAYRWGEDGLLGITDRECRLCFALALWNGRDAILKERMFGLIPAEGNHGEDVKEYYFYLDSTPTHSYMHALYKYPQAAYPYGELVRANQERGKEQPEYELLDTGVFCEGRYFDISAHYAKNTPNDILIRLSAVNRGPEPAVLDVLPMLWFRNTWTSGNVHERVGRPRLSRAGDAELLAEHETLGTFHLVIGPGPDGQAPPLLFTENETNRQRLYQVRNGNPYVKDAFHEYVVNGHRDAVNPEHTGTKAAARYHLELDPGQSATVHLRLFAEEEAPPDPLGDSFDAVFEQRRAEAEAFYQSVIPDGCPDDARRTMRRAYAGLLWNKQFYYYVVTDWLNGDPDEPPPPAQHRHGRNHTWRHIFNRNVLSMPDKWEFPWYAAWDLAFQMVPFARIDPAFAKAQLRLLLREWYMHPNGQLPAYEFSFCDVNPPVHAWACWRVYQSTADGEQRDREFLEATFQKLLLNFTWWVNRQDVRGRQVFSGGFLGMDNIGVFDRDEPLPSGECLEQADGTAWMAFYCAVMLTIALELAKEDHSYEDMASKFFSHFIAICDAINCLGGDGLWDEEDGFYYDVVLIDGHPRRLRVRSMVGLMPLIAVGILDDATINQLPGFTHRLNWFLENRQDLAEQISYMDRGTGDQHHRLRLLAIPSRERLERVLAYLLDEREFLSPFGIRSLSRFHRDSPYIVRLDGSEHCIDYEPGYSTTAMFGGNSNWRGPIWFPVNYLLVDALRRYHAFYGDSFMVACPTGSDRVMNLQQVADEIRRRLCGLFKPDDAGYCPWQGDMHIFRDDPAWRDLTLFNEYYHGETGEGLGASHQTGWTALVALLLEELHA